jgi:hypothetical protein
MAQKTGKEELKKINHDHAEKVAEKNYIQKQSGLSDPPNSAVRIVST